MQNDSENLPEEEYYIWVSDDEEDTTASDYVWVPQHENDDNPSTSSTLFNTPIPQKRDLQKLIIPFLLLQHNSKNLS